MTKYLLAISCIGILVGCTTTGAKFQPETNVKNKSTVYIYRLKKFYGSAWSPDVFVNGQKVFDISSGSYKPVVLDPGSHQVVLKTLGDELASIQFKTTADRPTYYLRFEAVEGQTDKSVSLGLTGAAGSSIVSAFAVSNFKGDKSAIETSYVTSPFTPKLFFVSPSIGNSEIADTHLAK